MSASRLKALVGIVVLATVIVCRASSWTFETNVDPMDDDDRSYTINVKEIDSWIGKQDLKLSVWCVSNHIQLSLENDNFDNLSYSGGSWSMISRVRFGNEDSYRQRWRVNDDLDTAILSGIAAKEFIRKMLTSDSLMLEIDQSIHRELLYPEFNLSKFADTYNRCDDPILSFNPIGLYKVRDLVGNRIQLDLVLRDRKLDMYYYTIRKNDERIERGFCVLRDTPTCSNVSLTTRMRFTEADATLTMGDTTWVLPKD